MDLIKSLNNSKIKRRNFFLTLGVSALGILSISRLPLKLFISKVTGKIRNTGKIRVTPNPMAVSRDKEGRGNG